MMLFSNPKGVPIETCAKIKSESNDLTNNLDISGNNVRVRGNNWYQFESVFDTTSEASDIIDGYLTQLINSIQYGYHCCIFTFGTEKSDKTLLLSLIIIEMVTELLRDLKQRRNESSLLSYNLAISVSV